MPGRDLIRDKIPQKKNKQFEKSNISKEESEKESQKWVDRFYSSKNSKNGSQSNTTINLETVKKENPEPSTLLSKLWKIKDNVSQYFYPNKKDQKETENIIDKKDQKKSPNKIKKETKNPIKNKRVRFKSQEKEIETENVIKSILKKSKTQSSMNKNVDETKKSPNTVQKNKVQKDDTKNVIDLFQENYKTDNVATNKKDNFFSYKNDYSNYSNKHRQNDNVSLINHSKKRVALFLDFDRTIIPESSGGMPITNKTKMMHEKYYTSVVKTLKSIKARLLLSDNIEFLGIYILTRAITSETVNYLKKHNLIFSKDEGNNLIKGVYGSFKEYDMFPSSDVTIQKQIMFPILKNKSKYPNPNKKTIINDTLNLKINREKYKTYESKWAYIKSFMIYELIKVFDIDYSLFDDDNDLNVMMVKKVKNVEILGMAQQDSGIFKDALNFYNKFFQWIDRIESKPHQNVIKKQIFQTGQNQLFQKQDFKKKDGDNFKNDYDDLFN